MGATTLEPEYRKYEYAGFARLGKWMYQLGGAFAVLQSALVAGLLLYLAALEPSNLICMLPLALTFLVFGGGTGILLANLYPAVWLGEENLMISFNWTRIRIPWEDVVNIRPCAQAWMHCIGVEAREITRFHMLYGIYIRSTWPTFLIGSGIQDYQELVKEIERRATAASWLFAENQQKAR